MGTEDTAIVTQVLVISLKIHAPAKKRRGNIEDKGSVATTKVFCKGMPESPFWTQLYH